MSLDAQYQVYNNLETAEARMLLPLKKGQFPVLHDDLAGGPEADLLPTCVGVDEVSSLCLPYVWLAVELIMLRPPRTCTHYDSLLVRATDREALKQARTSAGSGSASSGRDACMDTFR
jgi:hypothetical protein